MLNNSFSNSLSNSLSNSFNDQAHARGAAARTHLLAVASRPVWDIIGGDLNGVQGHLFGPPLSFWWDDDEDVETPDCGYTVTAEGVAVIPIHGTLVDSEPSWWMNYLGYCSIPQIARAVAAADADGNVKDVLLDVKSPGGHVSGLAAACDAVWAVRERGQKRVWAACSQVCSAAYEIASQCDRVYLAPDGMAGCIGTLYLLSDWSGYYSQMGVVTLRVASDGAETYKGAGARGTKITSAQEADFKRVCNEYRALFNVKIQRGRGFDDKTMRTLADARIHIGANALQLSLVDGIATPEAVLSALGGGADLDDLVGPPSQTPPDTDDDDDPTDTYVGFNQAFQFGNAFQKDFQENFILSANKTEDKTEESKKRTSGFFAWLNGEDAPSQTAAPAPGPAASPHPVLTAALAGGLDTPEKVNSLLAEQKTYQEAEKVRQEAEKGAAAQALTTAREAASNAAVTAFGQDSPQLKVAQEVVQAISDVAALNSLTSGYKAMKPAGLTPRPRQTKIEQTQVSEDAPSAEDKTQENLVPANVYNRRKPQARRSGQ